MLDGIRTELITLPAGAKEQIITRLCEAGISVEPSTGRGSMRLSDAGVVLTCTQGGGTVEILIVREDYLPQLQNMTAVTIFPSAGFFSGWKHRAENAKLREAIRSILYELKETLSGE